MKVFFDTSVLIAATVVYHENHVTALAALDRVHNDKDEGFVSAHSIAEMYSVLTKAPLPIKQTAEQALLSIEENVLKYLNVIALSASEYTSLIRESALMGVMGGTIYDAILIRCAIKSDANKILTFNLKHFQNVAPKNVIPRIASP